MIVLDASSVVEILQRTDRGLELADMIIGEDLHAPHLIDLEVAQTLRRFSLAGEMTASQAQALLDAFGEMPITRHEHTSLLQKIWRYRHNLTAYDAAYLILAKVLRAELVTQDEALAKMAGHPRRPR